MAFRTERFIYKTLQNKESTKNTLISKSSFMALVTRSEEPRPHIVMSSRKILRVNRLTLKGKSEA